MAVAPQTAQSARQATIRSYTDTAESYEGDWHAAFTLDDIPQGPFDERLLAWINYQLSASYTELNGAMQAYAAGQGAYNWSSMGTNIPPKGVGGFNYYVDSVNGSDANSGRSPSAALRTLAALPAIAAGKRIGLAKGSYWREELVITASGVLVGSYGTGARPIVDAADIILNAGFTKTAARTNVYETATIPFIMGGAAAAWVNVYENGKFLKFVADVATVDSTPGSYTISGMSTGGGVPASAKIYIQPPSSDSPITNGKLYEFSNRRAALRFSGNRGTIRGIEGRNACGQSGAFTLDAGDAGQFLVDDCLLRGCNDHAVFVTSGSRIKNSVFLNGYWGSASANFIVFYESVGSGGDFWSEGNIFQQDQNVSTNPPTCILSHTGTGMSGTLHSLNDWFISKNGAKLSGFFVERVALLEITGANSSELYQFINVFTDLTITNSQAVSAVSANSQIILQSNDIDIRLSGMKIATQNDAHQIVVGTKTGVTVVDDDGMYYKNTPNASALDIFYGTTAALTFNNTTFDGAITFIFPYNFSGTGATFTGGNDAARPNSYKSVNRWALNGVTYNSLAAWKAAVSPQDTQAIASRSGAAALTLPTMPVVS